MAKSIVTLFFLLFIKIYHAQWNFPYIQQWGTFVGGVGTNLSDFYNNDGLILDSQNNIYLDTVLYVILHTGRNSSPTLNERIFLLEEKKLYLFFFVVKHTMTVSFKILIRNLFPKFFTHAFRVLIHFQTTWTISIFLF